MPDIIDVQVLTDSLPLHTPFRISRGVKTKADVVTVTLVDSSGQHHVAECVPYSRYGETSESVMKQIEDIRPQLMNREIDPEDIQSYLPSGSARNAVEYALWKLSGRMDDLPASPSHIKTAQTVPLAESDEMVQMAQKSKSPILKIKLGDENDICLLKAVSDACPQKQIIIDANEGWDMPTFSNVLPVLQHCNVCMIEQPLPANSDRDLASLESPLPIYADESVHTTQDLEGLVGKYDGVNIKLDKTGGTTEAMKLKNKALKMGFEVMIGCMVCSSLSIEPALHLVDEQVRWVDLDGAYWLEKDRGTVRINYDFWEKDLGAPVLRSQDSEGFSGSETL